MTVQDIKDKIRAGTATIPEIAAGILNDKYLLFNFFMDNNLADVNQTLRMSLGHRYLPFAPDRAKIEKVIDTAIAKNDSDTLNAVIQQFDFNPAAGNYTTNPDLLTLIKFIKK